MVVLVYGSFSQPVLLFFTFIFSLSVEEKIVVKGEVSVCSKIY